jgi:hypothetical protein
LSVLINNTSKDKEMNKIIIIKLKHFLSGKISSEGKR